MDDARDLRLLGEPARDLQAARLVLAQAQAERPQPARGEPGVVGAHRLAEVEGGALDALEPLSRWR